MSYLVQFPISRLIAFATLQLLCMGMFSNAHAVLRDTEIENALRVYMQPLLQAGNVTDAQLNITIIADPTINAAVLPGGQIIVHSGLLLQADQPTEVAGVLAHELGHYLNNDLLKLTGQLDDLKNTSILGTALGLGLAIATQSAEPLVAGHLLGNHVGVRNHLQFTRSMESGADRRASALLHRSGLGLEGMVQLNKRMLELHPDPTATDAQYMRTHPLTEDRIRYFQTQASRLGEGSVPEGWQQAHDRVRAKLRGFLDAPQHVLERYREDDRSLPAQMARAIALMRLARYAEAFRVMEQVLENHPDDGFLHDLMGDIARNAGKPDLAMQHYTIAIKLLPWASLIRYQRAELLLKRNTPTTALAARDDLRAALRYEPTVASYWQSLAEAYLQLDEPAKADLAKAEAALLTKKFSVAQGFAKRAQLEFLSGSADWIRADDILKQVEAARK